MDRYVLLGQLVARRHRIDRPLIGSNILVDAAHRREFSDLGEGAIDFLSEAVPRTAEVGGLVLTGTGAVVNLTPSTFSANGRSLASSSRHSPANVPKPCPTVTRYWSGRYITSMLVASYASSLLDR
jgi:hypothetical protein